MKGLFGAHRSLPNAPRRRLSRRRQWRCRIHIASDERLRRGAAVHLAAQAVAAHRLAMPVVRVMCDVGKQRGIFEAEWGSLRYSVRDQSAEARFALERDCVVIYAGIVARAICLGWDHRVYGWGAEDLACDLVERLEYDEMVATDWQSYQREQARVFVTRSATWSDIERLTARLRVEPAMSGARVSAVLRDRSVGGIVVTSQIRVAPPTSPSRSNVELVWRPLTLTEVLDRVGLRSDTDGDRH